MGAPNTRWEGQENQFCQSAPWSTTPLDDTSHDPFNRFNYTFSGRSGEMTKFSTSDAGQFAGVSQHTRDPGGGGMTVTGSSATEIRHSNGLVVYTKAGKFKAGNGTDNSSFGGSSKSRAGEHSTTSHYTGGGWPGDKAANICRGTVKEAIDSSIAIGSPNDLGIQAANKLGLMGGELNIRADGNFNLGAAAGCGCITTQSNLNLATSILGSFNALGGLGLTTQSGAQGSTHTTLGQMSITTTGAPIVITNGPTMGSNYLAVGPATTIIDAPQVYINSGRGPAALPAQAVGRGAPGAPPKQTDPVLQPLGC